MMRGLVAALVAVCVSTGAVAQTKGKVKPKVPAKTAAKPAAAAKSPVSASAAPWQQLQTKERLVEIITDHGTMIAKLYDSTPLHRNNFVKLVEQGFYDSLLFHRVIAGFMIQGGDPNSKNAPDGSPLGSGSAPGERIPAEFKPNLFHKKGALAAARDNNPERASSNCQFYIVHGKRVNEQELQGQMGRITQANPGFNYTQVQKEVYARIGGTPGLDQSYTVFGEVISGLDVIDKIANVQKNPGDRPLQNVRMKMRMLN
ncbi:peptidylprolyl isomerase [Aridibaculum aurantiacum]|uniref:peptidylprolyl isomerase n=1 Tax=Aridibaculum aurantiacum TaxID=2810307 RepID=UPI001F60930E|nr:peptidylprolyl isomerase [Aridibaculum aurantiacum]